MTDTTELPSGRFVLRLEPRVHAALREAAAAAGLSLNEYCARKLASPGSAVTSAGTEGVEKAAGLLGADLLGVAVFGSWARAEATGTSDIDLLIAASPTVAIERSLYREWDDRPWAWNGRRVEPHFVHLPDPGARVSGLWAEVAVDGIVLFERDFRLSRLLVGVRRRIASGELLRRVANGQPYWVEAA